MIWIKARGTFTVLSGYCSEMMTSKLLGCNKSVFMTAGLLKMFWAKVSFVHGLENMEVC